MLHPHCCPFTHLVSKISPGPSLPPRNHPFTAPHHALPPSPLRPRSGAVRTRPAAPPSRWAPWRGSARRRSATGWPSCSRPCAAARRRERLQTGRGKLQTGSFYGHFGGQMSGVEWKGERMSCTFGVLVCFEVGAEWFHNISHVDYLIC